MAIDVCTEISSPGISPRISFSYDLKNQTSDGPQHRLDSSLLDSDLHFCFNTSFIQEISPADELFSNGKILPIHKKKPPQFTWSCEVQNQPGKCRPNLLETKLVSTASVCISSKRLNSEHPVDIEKFAGPGLRRARSIDHATSEKKLLKEFLRMETDQVDEKPTNVSKYFWKFKRSNSLNCDKGLIRSLQFLSRSNSTGSSSNPPKSSNDSPLQPQVPRKPHNLQRQASVSSSGSSRRSSTSSVSGSGPVYPYPVLRKCGSYGNEARSVRVSSVLNIPPICNPMGTVSFLGSLFCNGKDKKKKK